jgi:beta-fructofuranosidase
MGSVPNAIAPLPEGHSYNRPSAAQAAADAIPILVDDTYHVFHLTTPPFTTHHPPRLRSTWSRLRSTNLVDWTRDQEPVLKPGNKFSDPDADGVWTGAAVLDQQGYMNIFYTGYNLSENGKQVILRTRSNNRHGSKFPMPGKTIRIVGDGLSTFEDIDFRDPYVFYNESAAQFWMLVATRLAHGPHWSRGCVALLTSSNLDDWAVAPEPLYSPNDMFCPECPELFSLPNGKWYLVYSRFHAPDAGTVYRIADSPKGPFRIPRDGSRGRLDGRRWYAAKSCQKAGESDKRIYFGWLGDYIDHEEKWLWGGDLGVPREVSANAHGFLSVDIASEYRHRFMDSSLRLSDTIIPPKVQLASVETTATLFPELPEAVTSQDLLLSFRVGECEAHAFGIVLQSDPTDKGHRLQFTSTPGGSTSVSLLTDFPPLDDFWADQYNLHLPRGVDGPELVRHDAIDLSSGVSLLLRGRLVEAFFGGRSISFRLPKPVQGATGSINGDTRRLGWCVQDGSVELIEVSMWCQGS